jgi:uroporphyrinogen-III synthase
MSPSLVLYLGTDPTNYQHIPGLIHYPIIRIVPLEIPQHIRDDFSDYTHILFTSKNTVSILLHQFKSLEGKQIIAIGKSTAAKFEQARWKPQFIAEQESQEGVIELLKHHDLSDAYLFYPRSSLARKKLEHYLIQRDIRHQVCDLYETVFQQPGPLPDLSLVKEIIFTSPSTVKGFLAAYGSIPLGKKLTCIGEITKDELNVNLYACMIYGKGSQP